MQRSFNAAIVAYDSRPDGSSPFCWTGYELRAPRKLWHTAAQGVGPARNSMNLLVRINLALTTAFALAAIGMVVSGYSMLQGNAMREAPAPDGTATAAPMTLSPQQLLALEKHLAHHIGLLGHHLVKRAAATVQDWEHLVGRLAAEIDADPARAEFLGACRTLSRPRP
jgi:hypothetical protein